MVRVVKPGVASAALLAAVICGGTFVLPVEEAYAGELIRSARRINQTSGFTNVRRMRPSTKSVRALNSSRSPGRAETLRTSSPYEQRILDHQAAEAAYQVKLAKWQDRVDRMEAKQQEKELKAEEVRLKKMMREKQKMESARAKLKRKSEKEHKDNSLRNIFSRSEQPKTGAAEDTQAKGKKAEEFFSSGGDKSKQSVESGAAPAKPRLSFWQRLKKAFFGA